MISVMTIMEFHFEAKTGMFSRDTFLKRSSVAWYFSSEPFGIFIDVLIEKNATATGNRLKSKFFKGVSKKWNYLSNFEFLQISHSNMYQFNFTFCTMVIAPQYFFRSKP